MLTQDNETIILNHPGLKDEELEELFAIKALMVNPNAVLQNVNAWEKFCFAVNGIIPNTDAVDIPNVLMVACAVQKAETALHRKMLMTEPADHTTIVYIANVAWDEGWVILPDLLHFAQKELDKLTSDYAKELFNGITVTYLSTTEPWDDEDPISTHCAKMQTLNEYLKLMGEK